MFKLFNNPAKKLQKKYDQLMKEAFELSRVNRKLSDKKYAEADMVWKQIEEKEA